MWLSFVFLECSWTVSSVFYCLIFICWQTATNWVQRSDTVIPVSQFGVSVSCWMLGLLAVCWNTGLLWDSRTMTELYLGLSGVTLLWLPEANLWVMKVTEGSRGRWGTGALWGTLLVHTVRPICHDSAGSQGILLSALLTWLQHIYRVIQRFLSLMRIASPLLHEARRSPFECSHR